MKISHAMAALATLGTLSLTQVAAAKPITILYVPLDNRPVNTTYVEQTLAGAGCKVILPPDKFIASNIENGKPDKLMDWLFTKAPKADAAVISTDSLIYGGLVASRTHQQNYTVLKERVAKLNELERALPIKLYAFSTIMRTPRASQGRVEPAYYAEFGPKIFEISELVDKNDQHRLNAADAQKLKALVDQVPYNDLKDWFERRAKNLEVNRELLKLCNRKKFHFFAIGKDDNAKLCHTHMEARKLSMLTFNFPREQFQILDGVDQLGLLLAARAYNELSGHKPSIYPLYSEGVGQGTLPQYSDARFQDSVPQQIMASGSILATAPNKADFILAINSPDDGIVQDATAKSNKYYASFPNKRFIAKLNSFAADGHKISLADVSYSNGGDNGFMHHFAVSGGLNRLIAYNGWNTADNTIGYAIAQGIFAEATPLPVLNKIIRQRVIDDWFYQSNARNKLTQRFEKITREDLKYSLGALNKQTTRDALETCYQLSEKYDFTKNSKYTLSFPWDRLFEVNIFIKK